MSAGTVTVKATANDGSGVVGSQIIEIAVPLAIVGFNGANLDLVIPEIFDGSQAVYYYGYISDYGYTYYSILQWLQSIGWIRIWWIRGL